MRKALSLEPLNGVWDALNGPKGAQSFLTKLGSFLPKPRSRFCVFCRNTNLSVSAALGPSELMFALSLLPTATWRLLSERACSEVTSFTGLTYSRLRCPLCGRSEEHT